MLQRKPTATPELAGMTYAEIDARLKQLGWTLNALDETFEENGRRIGVRWGWQLGGPSKSIQHDRLMPH
jgi:hypothetical protein